MAESLRATFGQGNEPAGFIRWKNSVEIKDLHKQKANRTLNNAKIIFKPNYKSSMVYRKAGLGY